MNIRETTAPKISEQEVDKLKTLGEKIGNGNAEVAGADEKILERLDSRQEVKASTLNDDNKINGGKSIEYGLYCSDICIKSRVSSGRCRYA